MQVCVRRAPVADDIMSIGLRMLVQPFADEGAELVSRFIECHSVSYLSIDPKLVNRSTIV